MMTDTDTDIATTREAIADDEMQASHHLNSRVDFIYLRPDQSNGRRCEPSDRLEGIRMTIVSLSRLNCLKIGMAIVAIALLVTVSGCTNSTTPSPAPSSTSNPISSTVTSTETVTASPTSSPSPSTPTVTPQPSPAFSITSPSNGGTVSLSATMQGVARGLSSGQTLWLVVVPKSVIPTRYYPVDAPISIQSDGTWSKSAFVDSTNPRDTGQKFDIMLVSASQNADSAFKDYIAKGKSTGDYPGMLGLPQGATVQSAITVTRT